MKKLLLIALIAFFAILNSHAQSLSPERISKIKESTVRIIIENDGHTGTGFFINQTGMLLTCWHVIEPALVRNPTTNAIMSLKKIFAITNSGEKIELGIFTPLLKAGYKDALSHDFCILGPVIPQNHTFQFLKIGSFRNSNEGEEVYSCGYPKGIVHPFISKGIISTKFTDTLGYIENGITTKIARNVAYLDLTLNSGNSGGAIVKIGNTINDDEVIGIADFVVNTIGVNVQALADKITNSTGVQISGIDTNFYLGQAFQILNNTSTGISGCISIDYVPELLERIAH